MNQPIPEPIITQHVVSFAMNGSAGDESVAIEVKGHQDLSGINRHTSPHQAPTYTVTLTNKSAGHSDFIRFSREKMRAFHAACGAILAQVDGHHPGDQR